MRFQYPERCQVCRHDGCGKLGVIIDFSCIGGGIITFQARPVRRTASVHRQRRFPPLPRAVLCLRGEVSTITHSKSRTRHTRVIPESLALREQFSVTAEDHSGPRQLRRFSCYQCAVSGYASVSVWYSVASESQHWQDAILILNGGGGGVGSMSYSDSSSIDSLLHHIHFLHTSAYDASSPVGGGYLFKILNTGGGNTANLSFRDSYFAVNGNGGDTSYGTRLLSRQRNSQCRSG